MVRSKAKEVGRGGGLWEGGSEVKVGWKGRDSSDEMDGTVPMDDWVEWSVGACSERRGGKNGGADWMVMRVLSSSARASE